MPDQTIEYTSRTVAPVAVDLPEIEHTCERFKDGVPELCGQPGSVGACDVLPHVFRLWALLEHCQREVVGGPSKVPELWDHFQPRAQGVPAGGSTVKRRQTSTSTTPSVATVATRGKEQQMNPAQTSQLDELTAELGRRTGGKLLGEMTNEELLTAFATGPVHFRGGQLVNE